MELRHCQKDFTIFCPKKELQALKIAILSLKPIQQNKANSRIYSGIFSKIFVPSKNSLRQHLHFSLRNSLTNCEGPEFIFMEKFQLQVLKKL